jgi:hypothetical protein
MRYELTDREWAAIRPVLPNKPRGVPRVNDRQLDEGEIIDRKLVITGGHHLGYTSPKGVPNHFLGDGITPGKAVAGWFGSAFQSA